MNTFHEIPVIRITDGKETEFIDCIASEIAFTLIVNNQNLVSLLCSPSELDNMAVGFLLSEGFLNNRESLKSISVDEENFTVNIELDNLPENWDTLFNKKTITSGCGQGITFTDADALRSNTPNKKNPIRISTTKIRNLLRLFRSSSELYLKTGGVHSAALATADEILLFSEDIGRHNAVDKLIGKAFLKGMSMHDKLLLSSGRISGEIMTKVIRNNIPVLITRTAPTCMSISYAEDHGVTLIGFARGNRMNIYTHPLGIQLC